MESSGALGCAGCMILAVPEQRMIETKTKEGKAKFNDFNHRHPTFAVLDSQRSPRK